MKSLFNEHQLEEIIIQLFQQQGHDYQLGETISREADEVLLYDDLRMYAREDCRIISRME